MILKSTWVHKHDQKYKKNYEYSSHNTTFLIFFLSSYGLSPFDFNSLKSFTRKSCLNVLFWLCWLWPSYIILWDYILSIIQISSYDLKNNKLDFLQCCFLKTLACHVREAFMSLICTTSRFFDFWCLETSMFIYISFIWFLFFIFFYILILPCFELWLAHHRHFEW